MAATNKTPTPELVDVLIVGGAPAGLTSAMAIASDLHTAIVFHSQSYRNGRTNHFHMLPTWDGKSPFAFRDAARENTLENYDTIFYENVKIEKAKKNEDGLFELTDESGKVWTGSSLILATGITDEPLDIPSFEEFWAHCIAMAIGVKILTPSSIRGVFQADLDQQKNKPGWKMADYDATASYLISDPEILQNALSDPEYQQLEQRASKWADTSRGILQVGTEYTFIVVNTELKAL